MVSVMDYIEMGQLPLFHQASVFSLASRSYSQRLDVLEKGVLGSEEHDESIRDGCRSPQRPSFFDFFSPVDSAFQVSACLGHGS